MSDEELTVVVREKWNEAEGIVGLKFARSDGGALPPFEAGAHIDLHLSNGLVRQYSLVGDPADVSSYEIAVLRDSSSRGGSVFVNDDLAVGDELVIGAPKCDFALDPNQSKAILFAGGIGITPILAMATVMSRAGRLFELHYGAKSPSRMAFLRRLQRGDLANSCRLYFESDAERKYVPIHELLRTPEVGAHVYVCGPAVFIAVVRAAAFEAGWDSSSVHSEAFRSAVTSEGGAFNVTLARSGKVVEVSAGQTIAEALVAHGVQLPVSCQEGVCGTCVTRFLSGEVDHRDVYLSDRERTEGRLMTPCCSRARTVDLVLHP